MPEIPSRSLSTTDLDGLELAPEQFRLCLRSKLGINAGGRQWEEGSEVFDLGLIEVGEQRLYAVYALRQLAPGIGASIRARVNGAHAVVLNPSSQAGSSELA